MRAMTSLPASGSQSDPPCHPPAKRWHIAVLWMGMPLCVFGLLRYRLWELWPSGRFGELLLLSLLAWGTSAVLRHFTAWSWASAQALIWCAALLLFAGVLPVAATALLGVAAIALGGGVARNEHPALQAACGLVLLGATLGWLLPLPLHTRWLYLGMCVTLVVLRREALTASFKRAREGWHGAVASSPRPAALAVLAMGLASTGAWLPTLQVDDLGYHLRLPWMLMQQARYLPDPQTHIWALAPWLGDVLQAIPQLMAGAEARGPLNALWMLVTACGVWELASALGGDGRARWSSVALYASVPLTAVLAGSMQTEAPTTALLVWLAVLIARAPTQNSRALYCGAILVGGLLGLKLTAAVAGLVLLPWATWRHRQLLRVRPMLTAIAIVLMLGGSSYVYAGLISGNPFLPLLSSRFPSPYVQASSMGDMRWHAGFDPLLPWNLTFDTGQYLEAFAGGGGFTLIGLLGAWLLAFTRRATAVVAVVVTFSIAIPLLPMQYLRYAAPACVMLLPLLVVTAFHFDPRRATWLLLSVCVLNFSFQANGHWMLRTGALKQTILALGDDKPLFAKYAPERLLLTELRATGGPRGNVLALDPAIAFSAEMGARSRMTSPYDPSIAQAAGAANADRSGATWEQLLRREGISDVLLRQESIDPAQRRGLERAGAKLRASAGMAQWWQLPVEGDAQ
jgi:hypothetical protein